MKQRFLNTAIVWAQGSEGCALQTSVCLDRVRGLIQMQILRQKLEPGPGFFSAKFPGDTALTRRPG